MALSIPLNCYSLILVGLHSLRRFDMGVIDRFHSSPPTSVITVRASLEAWPSAVTTGLSRFAPLRLAALHFWRVQWTRRL